MTHLTRVYHHQSRTVPSNGISVYICAPYSSDPIANTIRAIAMWNMVFELGYEPFCPHLYHYANREFPRAESDWLAHDLFWQDQCDVVLRAIPGASKGSDTEVAHAEANEQPVFYTISALENWRKLQSMKTKYVVGIAMDLCGDDVALIEKKTGPVAVVGSWNGLGGKIDDGETPVAAMSREFQEESGVLIPQDGWRELGTLETDGYVLFFFCAATDKVYDCRTMEAEVVAVFDVNALPPNTMNNIRWMIPFAKDQDVDDFGKIPLVRH